MILQVDSQIVNIFQIGGIALFIVGGVEVARFDSVDRVFDGTNHPGIFSASVIVLGFLIFAIAFFGCYGAIRESSKIFQYAICSLILFIYFFAAFLLNLYALILLLIIVIQVLVSIFTLVYNQDVQQAGEKSWDGLWAQRDFILNKDAIDTIQQSFMCCGSASFLDYTLLVPESCCPSKVQLCTQLNAYQIGCRIQIKNIVQNSASVIASLTFFMACAEVKLKYFFQIKIDVLVF